MALPARRRRRGAIRSFQKEKSGANAETHEMKKLYIQLLVIFFCGFASAQTTSLVLGNPDGAAPDVRQPNNFMIERPAYVLSYNRSRGAPNWVTWHLQSSDIGRFDGSHRFRMDAAIPAGWPRVNHDDYTRTKFDRGHMCPNKDRSKSTAINRETFVMSNVQPQFEELNGGPWKSLEMYVRTQVMANMEGYITAGCTGNAGRIKRKVTIPTHCWKVILLLPKGTNDLSRITASTRVIAVRMENSRTVARDWREHRRSVDDLEQITGYDFLNTIPREIQDDLESKGDDQ